MKNAEEYLDRILCGEALATLSDLSDRLVHTIVTSPPYYRQRNYSGDDGGDELGQEETPGEYVDRLVTVFREARRVLRDDGSLWLVLGDKYLEGRQLGMPWQVALALQNDGWFLRSDIIWHKPNAMPSAIKNRPTTDHEYIFLLTKSRNYFYDADAVREPHVTFTQQSRMRGGRRHFFKAGSTPEKGKNGGKSNLHNARWDQAFHPNGRNRRTVWSVPLSKFREAHFAVFPERLVETCILAGSPRRGIVLDPFIGSGTTAVAARRHNRHFIGIDRVPEYCQMAQQRLDSVQLELL